MILEVRVYGGLEKLVPGASFGKPMEVEAPGGATAADLLRIMKIPEEQVFTILVNGTRTGKGDVLKPGDRVAFFPAVGGG